MANTYSTAELARTLGGRVYGQTVRCPGPGHSPNDQSLVVTPSTTASDGFVVHSFAGDDWRICRDHVRSCIGMPQLPNQTIRPIEANTRSETTQRAIALWLSATPASGSPIEGYFHNRFGGQTVPSIIFEGDALRWHGGDRAGGAVGAMLGLMTDPVSAAETGIHRTFVDASGRRIHRLMLGRKGIVRLWPDDCVTHGLAIGEGIESTIAGAMLTGRRPAWAALDAGSVAKFPVLSGIECLTVSADHDLNETGQRAAIRCADRWVSAGVEANLLTPRHPADFNDLLLGVA